MFRISPSFLGMVSEWLALNIHKVGKLDNKNFNHLYVKLAEGPGVASGNKNFKNILKLFFFKLKFFLA